MSNINLFIPLDIYNQKKNDNSEVKFILNDLSKFRKQKEKQEEQLEPDINNIQRYNIKE